MPPTAGSNNKHENKISKLLSLEENHQVFQLMGNHCQSIATAVVQLFITDPPNHANWIKKDTGVLCFVKDNMKRNFFFRLFCLRRNMMVWEHEMYNNMEYLESTLFLHTFEGQEHLIAFNFASIDEAKDLKKHVDIKIQSKRKKQESRRQHNGHEAQRNSYKTTNPQDMIYKKTQDMAATQTKRRRNITKADIGSPSDFKHLSHVGWSATTGFDVDNIIDEHWKAFFERAGVSEKQLQDKDTRDFIYSFINKHGGANALVDSIDNKTPSLPPVPPVPPRGAVRTPSKAHVRAAPPPPPGPVVQHSKILSGKPNDLLANSSNSTVPLPPPLPQNFSSFEKSETNGSSLSSVFDSTPASLQHALETLKPVEDEKMPPVVEARNDLLCEIRKGFQLKPVQEREVKPISQTPEITTNDLAGALARALAGRNMALHPDDDDDEEEDSNDDEWE